jgi:hypothetical protein
MAVEGLSQGAPPKNKNVPTFFLRFFEIFRSDFRKYVYGAFGLLMQRNGKKRDKKIDGKIRQDFFSSQLFRPKGFDMDFPQTNIFGVFELPLHTNAIKFIYKKKKEKRYLPTPFSGHLPDICRFQLSFCLSKNFSLGSQRQETRFSMSGSPRLTPLPPPPRARCGVFLGDLILKKKKKIF